jgi:hypothetical protein
MPMESGAEIKVRNAAQHEPDARAAAPRVSTMTKVSEEER